MDGKKYIDEINLHIRNLTLNMFTNIKEVELYDLKYDYSSTLKKKKKKHQFIIFQQVDECIPCEELSTNMKKFNDEQILIVDDIIYEKQKYPSKPLHIFLIRGA
jgi:hypothetical protein